MGLKTSDQPEQVAVENDADALSGEGFDRYRVIAKIGEGGCGVVYQAEQLAPVRREVAIKVIKLGMDTQAVIARFEAERQVLALMDHPHIAKVFDAGTTHSGRPFFVMELVSGEPITEFCDRQKLSLRQRLGLFIQICHAVQHAHQKGVIHRDLKPSNILVVEQDGKAMPKVIDFGVAKATAHQRLAGQTIYTAFDQFVGTPAYMSPEQAGATGEDIDTRSDIYSLGVLLYELLSGRPPFEPERLRRAALDEICRIIREEEPPLPSLRLTTLNDAELSEIAQRRRLAPTKFAGKLHGDLDWLAMKALEKDRSRRYDSATALAEDIGRHLRDEPVTARPPSALNRLRKMARRNKVVFGAGAAVACALIAGLTLSTAMYFREKQARGRLERRAYFSDMNQAAYLATARIGGLGGVVRLLESWRQHQPDLRGWEWYYLNGLCHHDVLTIRADSNGLSSVAWSPEGQRLATGGADRVVKIWDAADGHALASLRGHTQSVLAVAWSPDGRHLASGSADKTIRIWDLETRNATVLRGHGDEVTCLAWAFDSKRLASGSADGTVRVWDAATGANLRTFGSNNYALSLGWNHDGTRLMVSGYGALLKIWELASGRELWKLPQGYEGYAVFAAWSPDDKQVATGSSDNSVSLHDAATGANLDSFWDSHDPILSLAWSPDGTRLASATGGDGRIVVRDIRGGGLRVRDLRGHLGSVRCVSWRPDGAQIASASADGTVKIWNAAGDDPSCTPLLQPDQPPQLAWSAAGDRLAAGGRRAGPWIWDLKTRAPVLLPSGYEEWNRAVAWNADATRLAAANTDGVDLWDVARRAKLWHFGKASQEYSALAWSPGWKKLAAIGRDNHQLNILDAETGKLLDTVAPPPGWSTSVAWSPDGRSLAAGGGAEIYVWDAATLARKRILSGHADTIRLLAWSPDGARLASASDDASTKIWDVNRGCETVTLSGHAAPVYSVAWSPDGRRVATGSWDMSIKIWDPDSGAEICSFQSPGNLSELIYSVAWSPEGRRLAGSDIEGNICILDSTPGRECAAAAPVGGTDPNGSAVSTARSVPQTGAEVIRSLKLYCETVAPHEANNADALRRVAWIRATCRYPEVRDGRQAVDCAERAVAIGGRRNAVLLTILAAAYAETGDFSRAIGLQKEALTLVPTVELRSEYAAELKLYEAHQPYRDNSW